MGLKRDVEFLESTLRNVLIPITAGLQEPQHGLVLSIVQADLSAKKTKLQKDVELQEAAKAKTAPLLKNFLLFAAAQEVEVLKSMLGKQNLSRAHPIEIAGRDGFFFHIRHDNRKVPVGVLRAIAQGKDAMATLIADVRRHHDAAVILLAGMMGGVYGKVSLLDVVVPQVIFDSRTGTATKDGVPIVVDESEPRNFGEDVFDFLAGPVQPIRYMRRPIVINARKKTVCVPATWDNMGHEVVRAALTVNEINIVGMEMEGWAIANAARPSIRARHTIMAMIKGIADFGGIKPKKNEVKDLGDKLNVKLNFEKFDPREDKEIKHLIQKEATARSIAVAIKVFERFGT